MNDEKAIITIINNEEYSTVSPTTGKQQRNKLKRISLRNFTCECVRVCGIVFFYFPIRRPFFKWKWMGKGDALMASMYGVAGLSEVKHTTFAYDYGQVSVSYKYEA